MSRPAPRPERDGGARARGSYRICLLTETFHPEIGGGETQGRLLARALASRGHSVWVLTRRSRTALPREARVDGLLVRRIGPSGPGRRKKWGMLLTTAPVLIRRRNAFDVVLVSGFRILGAPAVVAAALLGRAAILKADSNGEMSGRYFAAGLAERGLRSDGLAARAFLAVRDALLRRAAAFVAISGGIERELRAAGVAPERIRRIPNCVDAARFRPPTPEERAEARRRLGLPADAFAFAYAGRLVTYKGLPLLVRTFADVARAHPRARLLLIGGGSGDMHACEPELRALAASGGVGDRVAFSGPVEDVAGLLRAADAFVFPSEEEAFGLALVEAMACGLPAVTTDAGGLADIAEHGRNALVVRPGAPGELRAAMERLLCDPELAGRLGAEALRTARSRYAVDAVTDAYEALLDSVAPAERAG